MSPNKNSNKMKVKGIFYEIKYDGAILQYKPKKIVSPLLKVLGIFSEKCEFPVSYLLNYDVKSFLGIKLLNIYFNRIKHGMDSPRPVRIGRFFFWKSKNMLEKHLLSTFDIVIEQNLTGANIGLSNLDHDALFSYYRAQTQIGLSKLNTGSKQEIREQAKKALSVYVKSQRESEDAHYITSENLKLKQG